jgi:hypothetical protein
MTILASICRLSNLRGDAFPVRCDLEYIPFWPSRKYNHWHICRQGVDTLTQMNHFCRHERQDSGHQNFFYEISLRLVKLYQLSIQSWQRQVEEPKLFNF